MSFARIPRNLMKFSSCAIRPFCALPGRNLPQSWPQMEFSSPLTRSFCTIPQKEPYPYKNKMKRKEYEKQKKALQLELIQLQEWVVKTGQKILIIFEGRDASGKGGTIKRIMEHLDPKVCRVTALGVPSDFVKTQWYYQRYVPHLPGGGEIVLFDRSWYNRAGVEKVMNYCTSEQYDTFMEQTPLLEKMLIQSGMKVFKLWFSVSNEEQAKRFQSRADDPLKQWKLSPTDVAGMDKWELYTAAKDNMFKHTSTEHAPWVSIRSEDKKRARLNAMLHILNTLDYTNKNTDVVTDPDPKIVKVM